MIPEAFLMLAAKPLIESLMKNTISPKLEKFIKKGN